MSEPGVPVAVARAASLHTWPAYRDAMRYLVVESDWQDLLSQLGDAGIPVDLT